MADRVEAHRNHLFGLWAARRLGLNGGSALEYAREVTDAAAEGPGEEAMIRKVLGDFEAEAVALAEHDIRRQLADLRAVAAVQVRRFP